MDLTEKPLLVRSVSWMSHCTQASKKEIKIRLFIKTICLHGPAKLQWFCLVWVFGKRFGWSFNSSRYIMITMDPNYILCSVPYAFSIKATAVRLLTLLIARCLSMNKIPNRSSSKHTHIKNISQGIEIIQLTSKFCYKLQYINCCRSQISLKSFSLV